MKIRNEEKKTKHPTNHDSVSVTLHIYHNLYIAL